VNALLLCVFWVIGTPAEGSRKLLSGVEVMHRPTLYLMVSVVAALISLPAHAAQATGFGPGEQSTYEVSYLGVKAGVAQVTVGGEIQQWGHTVWPIVTVATSDPSMSVYPVRDKFVSYWDPATQQTMGSDLIADENHKRRRQRVVLDHAQGKATVTKQKEGEAVRETEAEVKAGTRDVTAVTFALRREALAVGNEYHFPIYTGAKSFDLVAKVEATQTLPTRLGSKEVFRIRVKTEFSGKLQSKRDMVAYFTTDSLHVPVRIEADFVLGTLVAELTDFQPGRQLAAAYVPPGE
jgi:hypothetical protein